MNSRRKRQLASIGCLAGLVASASAVVASQAQYASLTNPSPDVSQNVTVERLEVGLNLGVGSDSDDAPRSRSDVPALSVQGGIPTAQAVPLPADPEAPAEDTPVLNRPAVIPTEQAVPRVADVSAGKLLSMPVQGRITSRFGMRFHPVLRHTKLHTGLDLAASCGTPVGAAAPGVVIGTGWAGGNGVQVRVDHGRIAGHHIVTTYNHLSSVGVRVGQRVETHQGLGRIGNTGYSTGCHLHFEVIANGRFTDPEPWLNGQPVVVDVSKMVAAGLPVPVPTATATLGTLPTAPTTVPAPASTAPVPTTPAVPTASGAPTTRPAATGRPSSPSAPTTTTARPQPSDAAPTATQSTPVVTPPQPSAQPTAPQTSPAAVPTTAAAVEANQTEPNPGP